MNKKVKIELSLEQAERLSDLLYLEYHRIERERRYANRNGYKYDYEIAMVVDELFLDVACAVDKAKEKHMTKEQLLAHNEKRSSTLEYVNDVDY